MNNIRFELMEMINKDNLQYSIVSKNNRLLLSPLYLFWWMFQLFAFYWFALGMSFFLLLITLLMSIGNKDSTDVFIVVFIYSFFSPFIWWYRYFKFGFTNTLEL